MRQKEHKEYLRYKFKDSEIKEFAQNLARTNRDLAQLELRRKEVTSALNAQLNEKKAEIAKLSTWISEGYEHRDVKCMIYYNQPETGKKTIVRLDTQEIVRELKMDDLDRQEELPLDNPNPPAKAVAAPTGHPEALVRDL